MLRATPRRKAARRLPSDPVLAPRPTFIPSPRLRAETLVSALRDDAGQTDREDGFPSRSLALLRERGLLAAPLDAQRGGESLGAAAEAHELLATLAAIGRGSLVVGRLYEGHVNALQLVERFGNDAQKDRAAAAARRGELFGVWNTESSDGVKLGATGEGFFRLAGSKTFASGLGHVGQAVVTAARDDAGGRGWQMLLLATLERRPFIDRTFWKPLGMRATASFRAGFDRIAVAPGDVLGAPGDYYREPAFSAGAVRFAAVQQGGVEAVFDETRAYLSKLGRTEDPHQRARLGEMAWLVESGRLWLAGAASHADGDVATVVAYARLMRSAIEDIAVRVLREADRAVGARGLLRPEPFERLHRDLTHYLRQPAPDAALAEAGRHVLDDDRPASALWS